MSTLYTVIPFSDDLGPWLESHGINPPPQSGRFPSPRELISVLDHIDHTTMEMVRRNQYHITLTDRQHPHDGPWVSLIINWSGACDSSDADKPQEFHFDAGWISLMEHITDHLTRMCGPLMLIPHSDGAPILFR